MTRVSGWPSRALLGRPLTSPSGEIVGILVDVLVDSERACATGLVLRDGRGDPERVIPYAHLELRRERGTVICADAVRAEHCECNRAASTIKISRLRNRRVLTHRGADIGAVDDVYLDADGRITAYDIVNSGCGSLVRLRGRLWHSWGVCLGETLTLNESISDEAGLIMQLDRR